jgi:hypothetical protein
MLAAPASIAAPPSPKSIVSWSPAVPPPPVCGAWLGTGLAAGVAVTVTVTLGVAVAVAVEVAVEVEVDVLLVVVLLAGDELTPVGG